MAAPETHSALAASLLDGTHSPGKRLLVVSDDREGRGRRLYRLLRSTLKMRGASLFEREDLRPVSAGRRQGAGADLSRSLLSEESLYASSKVISDISLRSKGNQFLLSLGDIGEWSPDTTLAVRLFLDDACRTFGGLAKGGARGVALALDQGAAGVAYDPDARLLLDHPATLRLDGAEAFPDAPPQRSVEARAIRCLRFCQLAFLPLSEEELGRLEGQGALARLVTCGAAVALEDTAAGRLVRLTDGVSPHLPGPAALPPAQIADYHRRLLALFEARGDSPAAAAARFHHAVMAREAGAIARWHEEGTSALLGGGRVREALSLLKEGLLVTAAPGDRGTQVTAIRRRLARCLAGTGQPLQAFGTIVGGDLRSLSTDDWHLAARSALEAGRVREAAQAIDSVFNGLHQGERALAPFKVLRCEIACLRGRHEEALAAGRELEAGGALGAADRLRLLGVEGKALLQTRQFGKAEKLFRECLAAARSSRDARQAVVARINVAVVKIRLGQHGAARAWLGGAVREARAAHFYREEAIALENLGALAHLERNYHAALGSYRAALGLLGYLDCDELTARISNNVGELCLRFGDAAGAREMLARSRGKMDGLRGAMVEGEAILLEGRILFAEARFADAAACFARAGSFFEAAGSAHMRAEALVHGARADLRRGLVEEARRGLDAAAGMAAGSERLSGLHALVRGELLFARGGDPRPALQEALAVFERLGDREGELECLVPWARVLLLRGEAAEAAALVARAREASRLVRCGVPADKRAAYDAMPLRRMLVELEASCREGGCGGGKAGRDGGRVGAARRPAREEADGTVDLGVLIAEGIGMGELKDRIERRCIAQALDMSGGNISRAAELLGMKRPRLSQLVKEYRLKALKKG